jgi:acetylornithine deacetylase/succinyl-diaminopimelate desuccinylase-like protein
VADRVIKQAIAIQQIPAPTFYEAERASYVEAQFAALGLQQIERDELHNVYGLLPGASTGAPAIMVSAHTDTIFGLETDLQIRTEGDLIYGPGLGDNSLGVAALLGLASTFNRQGITPASDIWFVATSREEGLGDLGGMKAAFARLKDRISAVINVEGLAFGHVYHMGIAVRRLRITACAEGGHSWLHFGHPSAVHGIVALAARIIELDVPAAPRTTYNIGMIEGGHAINALATHACLWLDLRSEAQDALAALEARVRQAVEALTTPSLSFSIDVVGDRPAGHIAPEHPLVQGALAALERVGVQGTLEVGSTDANIPLAAGCPAVTVGVTRGGNAHRLDEYIQASPVSAGLHQLTLLVLAAAHQPPAQPPESEHFRSE